MRFYINASEMYEEVKRDLAEMGIEVHPKTMQDKNVEGDPNFYTKELQNYSYCLLSPNLKDLSDNLPIIQPWCDLEFEERIDHKHWPVNPGTAYLTRNEVWDEFLHDGKFAYSYNERLWYDNQLGKVIERIKKDPESRQLWVSIWNPSIDPDNLGGLSRVPCSLGYGFQIRKGKLNMHYIMRSCDFAVHFPDDVYLANKLLFWVAEQTGYEVGTFTHTIFSFHVYNKDIEGVF